MTQASPLKKALEVIDKELDHDIEAAKKQGVSPLDVSMMDQILRPMVKMIEVNRLAETSADEFVDSMLWIMSLMNVELVLNTNNREDAQALYTAMNANMVKLGSMISQGLKANVEKVKTH